MLLSFGKRTILRVITVLATWHLLPGTTSIDRMAARAQEHGVQNISDSVVSSEVGLHQQAVCKSILCIIPNIKYIGVEAEHSPNSVPRPREASSHVSEFDVHNRILSPPVT